MVIMRYLTYVRYDEMIVSFPFDTPSFKLWVLYYCGFYNQKIIIHNNIHFTVYPESGFIEPHACYTKKRDVF